MTRGSGSSQSLWRHLRYPNYDNHEGLGYKRLATIPSQLLVTLKAIANHGHLKHEHDASLARDYIESRLGSLGVIPRIEQAAE